jgi:hypothetical protein
MNSNDTNDQAVNTRDDESGPLFLAYENRGHDGKKTRKIVQAE